MERLVQWRNYYFFYNNRNSHEFNGEFLLIDFSCKTSSTVHEQLNCFQILITSINTQQRGLDFSWLSQPAPSFKVLLQNPRPGLHSVFVKASVHRWSQSVAGGERVLDSHCCLPGLPWPPAWIPHPAPKASDNDCANKQTREHNTNT